MTVLAAAIDRTVNGGLTVTGTYGYMGLIYITHKEIRYILITWRTSAYIYRGNATAASKYITVGE